jgi:predicted dehydrogenase
MAYGPGTGDPSYELDGIDYPYAYVRWSEGRNMAAVLDLIADGSLQLEELITHEFPIDEAGKAFDLITGKGGDPSIAVLLRYPADRPTPTNGEQIALSDENRAPVVSSGVIRIGVIGAGSFATNEFLPLLAKQDNTLLRSITSATGVRARALGEQYSFEICTSDAQSVIDDDDIDCVFILTRHDTHAQLATAALRAGKHVFVEKPLALNRDELSEVREAQQASGRLLMVGFNRRYAPLAIRMKSFFGQRAQPLSISYRANVGYRPPEHWLHDPKQGGGVVLGEACHHIDFCNWFVGHAPVEIITRKMNAGQSNFIADDNVHITLTYADGSLAHVAYLSNGSKAWDAEHAEVFCDNKVAALTDFRRLDMARGMGIKRKRLWIGSDKGHAGQIAAFLAAIGDRGPAIDCISYLDSSAAAIAAADQLRS